VYVVSPRSERIAFTLAHFPLPLFHFAASDLPPPPIPDPSTTRPSPTLDGTDLIGRVFHDPDLGLCRVVEIGSPHFWRRARATSTQPAPTSKPDGFPPCDTPRWVGPSTPPLSLKWRSGSKPWLRPTSYRVGPHHLPPLC
jgi:hypothetical protein